MNLLFVGIAISGLSIALMRNENNIISMIGMLLLIIGLYAINKGRKQMGFKDK